MDMDMKSGEQEKEGQKVEEQSEGEKSTSEKTESASENAEEKKDKEEEEKTEAAKEDAGPPERPSMHGLTWMAWAHRSSTHRMHRCCPLDVRPGRTSRCV